MKVGLNRVLGPIERLIYRLCGTREDHEMNWKTYAVAMLLFNLLGLLVVYALQRLQAVLPLHPQGLGAVTPDSSFNTAASFATNTNWQGYGGETTTSYLTQMLGLNVQNFVSAAAGMATLVALIRGLARRTTEMIGNFWADLTRTTLYIFLPLALVLALIQVSQGVVQSFDPYQTVPLLRPTSYEQTKLDTDGNPLKDASGNEVKEIVQVTQQILPIGPAASQIAIKHLCAVILKWALLLLRMRAAVLRCSHACSQSCSRRSRSHVMASSRFVFAAKAIAHARLGDDIVWLRRVVLDFAAELVDKHP